jgi:predicted ATP-grasp superfamily ATP-dependent carboligase
VTVLVTCGQTRGGLAAVRALGREGVAVAVGAPVRPALAMWSRYATSTLVLPEPSAEARRFASDVAEELAGRHAIGAFAATDAAIWALSRFRDCLGDDALGLLPPHEAVVFALDRSALRDRAKAHGVACVSMWRIDGRDDVEPLLTKLQQEIARPDGRLSAIVRPLVQGLEREDGTRREVEAVAVERVSSLRRLLYERDELVEGGCIVELRPPGTYLGYGAVCDRGEVVGEVFQERLRERDDLSGISTLARTIDVDEAMRHAGRTLIRGLSYHGPCLIEFVRGEDGVVRLVNFVPRLWGSLALACRAGLNVPWLALRVARGDVRGGGVVARPGVVWRWGVGDTAVLTQRVRRALTGTEGRGVIRRPTRSLRTLVDQATLRQARDDVFEVDDPLPAVLELQQRLHEVRAARTHSASARRASPR